LRLLRRSPKGELLAMTPSARSHVIASKAKQSQHSRDAFIVQKLFAGSSANPKHSRLRGRQAYEQRKWLT